MNIIYTDEFKEDIRKIKDSNEQNNFKDFYEAVESW